MLDTDTKRRIDSCRDILVGKVPDPKSQVEQITIALIYKFMDDMDAEAEELGGKRSFFAGEYAKYGWAKLMAPNMGGFDVLALYSEAIQKMNENPGIPPLFRDIFKNAYLPYRDPETLRIFLKEIDGFTYDHSERLGDAFEYLLSVLGSQGDAGQFRTPRHIIDFMVEIIDPKKGESLLDPACGTAGFLISAWKHILKQNTSTNHPSPAGGRGAGGEGAVRAGDLLTPDERQRLAANIHGYDISPDMVRLSLVNLYLHGFTDPHIVEYDTLTSEEKWNETADVILANPPFMSPKGGIKPHKRFSVQSTRSEVLFVDYMAEHLSPQGRAAIIVPEGVIFQSGTAYKQLREMLVKNSLVAVVSLPAGVFNPYSGVKTSILMLDKRLAKKADSVLFVKVENDGFNLGAQRRAVTGSGLPEARRHLREFFANPDAFENAAMAHKVERVRIGENGEWNLSGDRYVVEHASSTEFELYSIGNICEINPESIDPVAVFGNNTFEYIDISSVENGTGLFNGGSRMAGVEAPSRARRKVRAGDVLISTVRPNLKAFTLLDNPADSAVASTGFAVLRAKPDVVLSHYVLWLLRSEPSINQMVGMMGKGAYPSINQKDVESIRIPLPSLAIQQEIVAEIEGYQKIIDGARQVVENHRPRIVVRPDWPTRSISEVSKRITKGSSPNWQGINYTTEEDGILFITSENIGLGQLLLEKPKYVERRFNEIESKSILRKGDVLTNIVGASIGRTAIFNLDQIANVNQAVCVIRPDFDLVDSTFLMTLLNAPEFIQVLLGNSVENARANVSMGVLGSLTIPLPPLVTQQAIVAEIEAEQALVNANKELIRRFEAKIKTTINRVWGESDAASSSRAVQSEEPADQADSASTAPCAMSLAS